MSGQKDILKELAYEDLHITFFYTRQSIPAGLGHAISCAKDFVGDDPFIIALGNSIIYSTENNGLLSRMVKQYETQDSSFVIGTRRVPMDQVHRYGIIDPVEDSKDGIVQIKDMIEKPSISNAPSNFAIAARYIMPHKPVQGRRDTIDRWNSPIVKGRAKGIFC